MILISIASVVSDFDSDKLFFVFHLHRTKSALVTIEEQTAELF